MKFLKKNWPVFFFLFATFVYYWKVFLKGYVPFPGDLMVGAYLPWLESKWGYPTGVPVKNSLISDIFSQFFIWKSIVGESWKNFQVPLWNPYTYSGYPLLATFHSAVFNPFMFLYPLLGDTKGWNLLVILPSFASALTMYWYLRTIKIEKLPATIGGIIYAYSGFAISWAQFVTADHAMIWMPLVFIVFEKYFESKKVWYLYLLPAIFFLLVTAGHFQIMVYISVLTVAYFLWRWYEEKRWGDLKNLILPGILSVGIVSFQILPTIELMNLGLRSSENYIKTYNYGLLPLKYLATLIAPDFFGNPATGNFFGAFNYHEAIFYTGILPLFGFVMSLFLWEKNKYLRFFVIVTVMALLLGFDTPVGKAVYTFNLPGVSTSAAGRIAVIFSLGLAVLSAISISRLKELGYKKILISVGVLVCAYSAYFYLSKFTDFLLTKDYPQMLLVQRQGIALRNMILPGLLIMSVATTLLLSRKWSIFTFGLLVITALDMFRFGWKYIPFVPEKIVYPTMPVISYLQEKSNESFSRIERENAEIMTPMTWMQYRLQSPSGYDPMAIKDYVKYYQEEINGDFNDHVSRYSELGRYDAKSLGKFSVKYLLVTKRDEKGLLGGNNISHNVNQKEWKKVYETKATAVLENTYFQPRVRFIDATGSARITSYTPNKVRVQFENGKNKTLLLADTFYPGWRAYENGKNVEILKCETVFRCVKLNEDRGEIVYSYEPNSFWLGIKISILSLLSTIFLGYYHLSRRTGA